MMQRKKFFGAVGLGILGIAVSGFSPLKFFTKKRNSDEKVNVKINPLAIKRTGK
jgi:hypothetical protein